MADLGAGLFVAEESRRLTELHLAAIEQQMQIGSTWNATTCSCPSWRSWSDGIRSVSDSGRSG